MIDSGREAAMDFGSTWKTAVAVNLNPLKPVSHSCLNKNGTNSDVFQAKP